MIVSNDTIKSDQIIPKKVICHQTTFKLSILLKS
jgi:hypothetical protein